MCNIKRVLVSVGLILLLTASFFMYWVYPEKKMGQYSEIKFQNPCGNEYNRYCLNGGQFFNLIDEDAVDYNCTWLYGGKRCEEYM